eukprot:2937002-Rhodomonas_salina.2
MLVRNGAPAVVLEAVVPQAPVNFHRHFLDVRRAKVISALAVVMPPGSITCSVSIGHRAARA